MSRSVEVIESVQNSAGAWLTVVAPSWQGYEPLVNDERLRFDDGRPGQFHVVSTTPHSVPMLVLYLEEGADPPKAGDILRVVEAIKPEQAA